MHVAFRPDHQGIPEATRVILDCHVPSLRERCYNTESGDFVRSYSTDCVDWAR